MSPTEQDLRDLLADRSAVAPTSPDRLTAVQRRVRRRSRRQLAMVTVGLVAVAGLSIVRHGSVAGPSQQPASPPATSTPLPSGATRLGPFRYPYEERDQIHTATVDGLHITTDGPHRIAGTGSYPFTVNVTLTNTTTTAWRGTVGVGLYGSTADSYFGRDPFLYAADYYHLGCCESATNWFAFNMTPAFRIQGIADPSQHVIRPGQTVTIQIAMVKPAYGIPHVAVRGWVPVLDPLDPSAPNSSAPSRYPNPTIYPTVDWG